jgi:hypothetical protein
MIGSGDYNGLQAKLTRRMSRGLQLTAAYTWSHTLDNSASAFGTSGGVLDGTNSQGIPNGSPLLQYERGNSDTDQRQIFTLNSIYELPFGRGKTFGNDAPRAVDYVIGGWQWNNVIQLASGTPLDISGAPNSPNGRPDYHGGCTTGDTWQPNPSTNVPELYWIRCSAGAFTAPAGLVGNLERNAFPGPPTRTWDTSLVKNITIGERVTTQLRAQVYNLFNTPQFQNPDTNYNNGDFGQLLNARIAPRIVSLNSRYVCPSEHVRRARSASAPGSFLLTCWFQIVGVVRFNRGAAYCHEKQTCPRAIVVSDMPADAAGMAAVVCRGRANSRRWQACSS